MDRSQDCSFCARQKLHDHLICIYVNDSSWDDWAPQDRIVKLNDEGRALQKQIIEQNATNKAPTKSVNKKTTRNGSEFSSRASEERFASVSGPGGRGGGRGRGRDFDLETVSQQNQVSNSPVLCNLEYFEGLWALCFVTLVLIFIDDSSTPP